MRGKNLLADRISRRGWQHNTSYYRDGSHIWKDGVTDHALFHAVRAALGRAQERMHVWSCGCSSGEELFTAFMLFETWVQPSLLGHAPAWHGFGTDRSAEMVAAARGGPGEWSESELALLPSELWLKYFEETPDSARQTESELAAARASYAASRRSGKWSPSSSVQPPRCSASPRPRRYSLDPRVRHACVFEREDLSQPAPAPTDTASPKFELILCRYSIFLYSDEPTARRVLERIVDRLAPDGLLVLGISDPLPQSACAQHGLEPFGAAEWNAWRLVIPRDAATLEEEGRPDPGVESVAAGQSEALSRASCLSEFRKLSGLSEPFATDVYAWRMALDLSDNGDEVAEGSPEACRIRHEVERLARFERTKLDHLPQASGRRETLQAVEAYEAYVSGRLSAAQARVDPFQFAVKLTEQERRIKERRERLEQETLAFYAARFALPTKPSKPRARRGRATK